jgi:hypothetical protein
VKSVSFHHHVEQSESVLRGDQTADFRQPNILPSRPGFQPQTRLNNPDPSSKPTANPWDLSCLDNTVTMAQYTFVSLADYKYDSEAAARAEAEREAAARRAAERAAREREAAARRAASSGGGGSNGGGRRGAISEQGGFSYRR